MSEKIKTVVDRRTWMRGPYTPGGGYLRSESGMRCCLGFRCAVAGLSDNAVTMVGPPCEVASDRDVDGGKYVGPLGWMVLAVDVDEEWSDIVEDYIPVFSLRDTDAAEQAMAANDDETIDDEERERIITEIFARNGEEIEFVGPRLPKIDGREVRYEDAPDGWEG